MREAFPHLSDAKIVALPAILQGAVTAPFLTPAALTEIYETTKKF